MSHQNRDIAMPQLFLALAGLFGLIAVALGAFAAHGLKNTLTSSMLSAFETGVQYQMYHALALALAALLVKSGVSGVWLSATAWLWVAGIVLFSGSLYALALTGIRIFGPITPLGGLCFLAGWACLIIAAFKHV